MPFPPLTLENDGGNCLSGARASSTKRRVGRGRIKTRGFSTFLGCQPGKKPVCEPSSAHVSLLETVGNKLF